MPIAFSEPADCLRQHLNQASRDGITVQWPLVPLRRGRHDVDAINRAGFNTQIAASTFTGRTVCIVFALPKMASTGQA